MSTIHPECPDSAPNGLSLTADFLLRELPDDDEEEEDDDSDNSGEENDDDDADDDGYSE